HWTKDEDGRHRPETARLHCESCGVAWSEGDRLRALKTIRWHQTRTFECCGLRQSPLMEYENAWRDNDYTAIDLIWTWSEDDRHAVYLARCRCCGALPVSNVHAGFQASKLFSPWQKDKPSDIAGKYLKAKGDPDKEQAWWNTQMGLPHRPVHGKAVQLD